MDHWIFDADLFLHEVKYFLTRELSVEYIKEKTRGKIYYLKEKLGELKKNFMCLKSRLRMYAWQQKKKKYNLERLFCIHSQLNTSNLVCKMYWVPRL